MMSDLISRQAAIECLSNLRCGANCFDEEERSQYTALSHAIAEIELVPSARPSDDYNRGWEDGQNAVREEQWENGRDRLD